jgi:hypothetical protein
MLDKDLPTYLRSTQSRLGFFLIAMGCFALLAFFAALAILFAVSDEVNDLGGVVWLLPFWGAVAIPLGRSMRRAQPSAAVLILGHVFLVLPAGMALIARF